MRCVIYKGHKKLDSYLFIEKKDDFSRIPEELLALFGELELVMALDLKLRSKLACVSASEVIKHLQDQGYYLQSPPKDYIEGRVPPPSF